MLNILDAIVGPVIFGSVAVIVGFALVAAACIFLIVRAIIKNNKNKNGDGKNK